MRKGCTVPRKASSSVLPLVFCAILSVLMPAEAPGADAGALKSFYDLKVPSLEGDTVDLAAYRGKVTLVVNVASHCGYTPQYSGLEKLHRELSAMGFSVLGFPSNDFRRAGAGTAKEIRKFCSVNYDVTFRSSRRS